LAEGVHAEQVDGAVLPVVVVAAVATDEQQGGSAAEPGAAAQPLGPVAAVAHVPSEAAGCAAVARVYSDAPAAGYVRAGSPAAHLEEDALRFERLMASQEAAVYSVALVPPVDCAVMDKEHSEVLGLAGRFPVAAERSAVLGPAAHSPGDAKHSAAFAPADYSQENAEHFAGPVPAG